MVVQQMSKNRPSGFPHQARGFFHLKCSKLAHKYPKQGCFKTSHFWGVQNSDKSGFQTLTVLLILSLVLGEYNEPLMLLRTHQCTNILMWYHLVSQILGDCRLALPNATQIIIVGSFAIAISAIDTYVYSLKPSFSPQKLLQSINFSDIVKNY